MHPHLTTDIAIIGAGPVGLFAAFECGMLRLSSVLIDALDTVGGQCAALYPEKPIFDIPGFPMIEAAELITRLEAQIAPFAVPRRLGQRVVSLSGQPGCFRLGTDGGVTIEAAAILVAAGAGAFGPNRPPLDGLPGYEASGAVRYFVTRRQDLAGKRVVIAGGGDSALDWALALAGLAASVSLVHRRAKFRAAPQTAALLEQAVAEGRITLIAPYQLHALEGNGTKLDAVVLADLDGGLKRIAADQLLAFFGLSTELGSLASFGFGLEGGRIRVDPATGATSLPGIFAIGDVASYPGKLKLILQGFSEAAMAAHAAHAIVHPGHALHFVHSTTQGPPGR